MIISLSWSSKTLSWLRGSLGNSGDGGARFDESWVNVDDRFGYPATSLIGANNKTSGSLMRKLS